jgi:purine nucleosidase
MAIPVLVDTDPGLDDALALLLAFRSPEWRVVAVTVVAGNVAVEIGYRNVARVLAAASPSSAPRVAIGAAGPRVGPLVTATHIHGDDGLGGLSALREASGEPRFPEASLDGAAGDAVELLLECARRWPGELRVVTLGPLTNVAAALERDPEALRLVRDIVVMGGSVSVGGNVTSAAEFNVFVDPEAAACVLAAGLPLTMVPLDVTHQVVWPASRIARLAARTDRLGRFAHAVATAGLRVGEAAGEPGLVMHDPLTVGVALDPTLVETVALPVAVETAGTLTRGMTVVDRRPITARRRIVPTCHVALRVDAGRFLDLYEVRLCGASA